MKRKVQLTTRDVALLDALWKWKMLTSAGIWRALYDGRSANTFYVRLLRLKKAGLITLRPTDSCGSGYVWILTKKGFSLVREKISTLKEIGYQSENIEHDLYVTAVHAGEWLAGSPSGVELFSEQQLRRLDPDCYPNWVPTSSLRRPDGYWRIPFQGRPVTIALEVELSKKGGLSYPLVGTFYEQQTTIFRVVWVVGTESLLQHIRSQIEKACPRSVDIHNFLLLDAFKNQGWSARFVCGREANYSLRELLNSCVQHAPSRCRPLELLDFRKCPGRSRASRQAEVS
jgi:hypothetical protein